MDTSYKVKELLKEVQLDYSSTFTKAVDEAVSAINEAIDKIPEDLKVTADVAPSFVRDIGADKVEFKFKKPNSVEIGGSYSFQCIAKPDVNVDLFVQMPKECFHEKDYLNYRYHAKRFLYLCIIKKYLNFSPLVQNFKWSTLQNEARKPILNVCPAVNFVGIPEFVIRIIPTAKSLFNSSKLNLERNNVRALNQATPKYNSSILEDMYLEDNAEFIRRTFSGWKELGEALILLKVWGRQRSSIYAHDCLSGFLLSVILAYLGTRSGKNRIRSSMNTMQIFRVTLDFIATSKSWETGILFQRQSDLEVSSKEERRKYLQSFPVVICDAFADFNFAFRMTKSGFLELRTEAALALTCIDKCRDDGFDELFMTKIDFASKYDICIRLNLKGNSEIGAKGFCLDDECWRYYEQKVFSLTDQGLRNRARFIRVIWRNTDFKCDLEDGLKIFDGEPLLIGILLGSLEEAFKQAVKGPSPENKDEALEFRKFWGDKSEIHVFGDGTINETVVWEHKSWERHLIIKEIVQHILSRHLSLSKENILPFVDQLDFALCQGNEDPISSSESLLKAFDELSKCLRLLNDIPLKISSVQPLESAFRFTSVFPPAPHPLAYEKGDNIRLQKLTPTCIQPLEVMIQLEGSGNWPMDDISIEKTKSAFLLKIGERWKFSLQNTEGIMCTATEDDVDVFMSGYAFRLRILHERGLSLLRKQIGNNQTRRVLYTDRKLFIRGQHSSMINGLQRRYPLYGPVVRLAKRWVSAHFFSRSLVEEAIELLVAYIFLNPLPFSSPCSRITGFLRFLRLLSDYDWTFSALVIDINGDFTPDDKKEVNENFMSTRKVQEENTHGVASMFLATTYDKASEAWTSLSPTATELKRLVAYARSSANLLTKVIMQHQLDCYTWECLFRTPLSNFDAIILLHRDKLSYPQRLLFPSEVSQGKLVTRGTKSKIFHPFILPRDLTGSIEELKRKLMVNFDPLKCLVGDLEREFPNMFKVWYDSLGGDAIGLTWQKMGSKKRQLEDIQEEKNHYDVMKSVGEVGKGLVRSIYVLKSPRLR